MASYEEKVENDNMCYCCGTDNDRGLQMTFQYPEQGIAESELAIPRHFTGWKQMVHGGFLSMVLDEIMAHACISKEILAVTAEMTVRYKNPAVVGADIKVSGKIVRQKGKIIETVGEITGTDGTVYAEAKAKFISQLKA